MKHQKQYIDVDTGEIVMHAPAHPQQENRKHKPAVVDGLFLSELHTAEELLNVMRQYDDYIASGRATTFVDHEHMVDAFAQGCLTQKQTRLLQAIIDCIVGWNHAVCDVSRLQKQCEILDNHFMRELNKMSGYVRILYKKNSTLHVAVNPILAWKGNLRLKNAAVTKWYTRFGGE